MIWTIGDLITFDFALLIGVLLSGYYILKLIEKDIKIQNDKQKSNQIWQEEIY